MKTSLLQQAMSPEILNLSWKRLAREHTPWSPTISRKELQRDLLKHILQCREEILAGSWSPQSLRQYPMKKPDGRQRIISAQYLQDKLIQRALLIILEPRAEALFHDDSFGYRPRRNVQMALQKSRERIKIGQDWLVDADIKGFFDNIPHRPLLKILTSFITDKATMKIIRQWLSIGAHHSSLLQQRRGISQGAILSPLFCNLYLHQLDSAFAKANIPFVRFADDFLLFTTSKAEASAALAFATHTLTAIGLEIHPQKTRIARSSQNLIFLGEKLPNVSR